MRSVALVAFLAIAASFVSGQTVNPTKFSYTETHTLYYTLQNDQYSYTFKPNDAAKPAVVVDRNPNAGGWDYIRFAANSSFLVRNFTEAYFAAGYAEGYITYDSMYSSYLTGMSQDGSPTFDEQFSSTPQAQLWLQQHISFMRQIAATNKSDYGRQIGAMLRQIDGLTAGYNAGLQANNGTNATGAQPLTWTQVFYISFQSEMARVVSATSTTSSSSSSSTASTETAVDSLMAAFPNLDRLIKSLRPSQRRLRVRTHCSALVKVTGDDIFFAHDTWGSYNTMVRQYKTYAMQSEVTMSGYPGSLSSIDDWYMTSYDLAVTETSMAPMNNDLDSYVVHNTVSEFMRVMLANYLATSAPEWVTIFSDHNSGTYNNQYMILDVLKAKSQLGAPGASITLLNDTFWVLEQTPGYIEAHDMTWFLNQHTYWPSYNIPYFPYVFDRLGYTPYAQQMPFLFNYSLYSRAKIFAKRHSTVTDLSSMFYMMRYNEYQTDPFSQIEWCVNGSYVCKSNVSAMLSIASRGDLAPAAEGNGAITTEGPANATDNIAQQPLGAIDTKITSVKAMTASNNVHTGYAINGPTSVGLPVYKTSVAKAIPDFFEGMSIRGVPDVFDFPLVEFDQSYSPSTAAPTMAPAAGDDGDSKKTAGIVVGTIAGVGVVGTGGFFAYKNFARGSRVELYEGEGRPLV